MEGAAAIVAADLGAEPDSELRAQLCGDTHLSNFGGFASPERRLMFDVNDLDETLPGPWERDVKRLLASLAVAGRSNGLTVKERETVVRGASAAYRTAMAGFAEMGTLDVWYSSLSADEMGLRSGTYADQDERNYKALLGAVQSGWIAAQTGV